MPANPPTRQPSVRVSPQPQAGLCTRPRITSITPAARATALSGSGSGPRTSSCGSASLKYRRPSASTTTPIGRVTQNAQRQVPTSTTTAPSDGPSAVAIPPIADHAATAVPRRVTGTSARMTWTVDGVMRAAPSACTTRAPMRNPGLGARAQATPATLNTARPLSRIRLRPKRSETTAARISVAPLTIV